MHTNIHTCMYTVCAQQHGHAVDAEAGLTHQPIRSLPLPALQSSSYRQTSSSDICNIYTFSVMHQITTVTLSV